MNLSSNGERKKELRWERARVYFARRQGNGSAGATYDWLAVRAAAHQAYSWRPPDYRHLCNSLEPLSRWGSGFPLALGRGSPLTMGSGGDWQSTGFTTACGPPELRFAHPSFGPLSRWGSGWVFWWTPSNAGVRGNPPATPGRIRRPLSRWVSGPYRWVRGPLTLGSGSPCTAG
jgi:hypothetical protein